MTNPKYKKASDTPVAKIDIMAMELEDAKIKFVREMGWQYRTFTEFGCYWYWFKKIGDFVCVCNIDMAYDHADREFREQWRDLYDEECE